jgi:hypothetical protein
MKTIIGICIILFILIGFVLFSSCSKYEKMSTKCKSECTTIQENNVGFRFMWRNIDFTFGKCTCYSRSGTIKIFFIGEN